MQFNFGTNILEKEIQRDYWDRKYAIQAPQIWKKCREKLLCCQKKGLQKNQRIFRVTSKYFGKFSK